MFFLSSFDKFKIMLDKEVYLVYYEKNLLWRKLMANYINNIILVLIISIIVIILVDNVFLLTKKVFSEHKL